VTPATPPPTLPLPPPMPAALPPAPPAGRQRLGQPNTKAGRTAQSFSCIENHVALGGNTLVYKIFYFARNFNSGPSWPRLVSPLHHSRPEPKRTKGTRTAQRSEMAMARRRLFALASRLQATAPAQPWRRAQPRSLSSAAASGSLDRLKTPPFARPAARNPASSPWDRFGG
jgi:hypothetical protein